MKTCRLIYSAGALLALLGLVSCASRSSLSSWYDQNYRTDGFNNICVLARHDDLALRQEVENGIVEKLTQQGIRAIPSLSVISPSDKRLREQLESTFDSLGVDAILIVRGTGQEDVEEFVPETTYYKVYDDIFNTEIVERTTEGGYWANAGVVYFTKTSLFANNSDKLVWEARSQTAYDGNIKASVGAFAKEIVNDLVEVGLLRNRMKK